MMESESKTSDEILEELFSALNVPLSPKTARESLVPGTQENSEDSEGSEDKEADSKSSASEEDAKVQEEEEKVEKYHKHRTSKKKKEKKKKKKKHKRKGDDSSSHKSKKKHKRDSLVECEGEHVSKNKSEEALWKTELLEKLLLVVSGPVEKSDSSTSHLEPDKKDQTKTKSPKSEEDSSKPLVHQSTKVIKSDLGSESGCKEEEEPSKKPTKKLNSPQRSNSSSKSIHSRSRSNSRIRKQPFSRSRSRSRSSSRARFKLGKRSRSRSRSRLKYDVRQSRSGSRSTSQLTSFSSYKSKAKSPHVADKVKQGRKSSRSHSKSLSPKRSKRRKLSRSRSRSLSPKRMRRRLSRSYSKSVSPRISRKKRMSRSRSPSSKACSNWRSRSKSRSPKRLSHPREPSNLSYKAPEGSTGKPEPLKNEKAMNIDLSSIPTPDVKQSGCLTTVPVSLESIPLPVPPPSLKVPDPSSIPLPRPVMSSNQEQSRKESDETVCTGIDLGTIPVPVVTVETPTAKEQETAKPAESGSEKGRAKTIIIKSLKDSLIYMQAQEEAERRAKVKQEEEDDDDDDDDDDDVDDVDDDDDDVDVVPETTEVKQEENDDNKEEEKEEKEDQLEEKPEEEQEEPNKEEQESKGNKEIGEENLNGMEEGEILSEEDNNEEKHKSHKKKSKKDKDKSKEKKKAKKEKNKEKKRKSRDRSRSKERTNKSRSRSKERSRHKRSSSGWHRDRDSDRRHRRHSRSRSLSRDRFSRFRHRSYSRSRSRSRSRSGRKRDCVSDLRDKVTRKRLLEIARRNAVYLMQNGCLPPSVEQEQLVKIKTGGKSVEELTDFCKQLVATGNYSDVELSDPSLSSDDDNANPEKPFSYTRHPFSVRDSKPILMNIRNAPMLPTKTNAERLADHAKLREQFPVSSGSQHRTKGEVTTSEEKVRTDSGWVPVSPKEKKPQEDDSVFSKEEPSGVDISQIVSSRLSAMRKLQDNPHDVEALKTLHNVQKEMQTWALSKQEPGQFTGSTGVKILSQEELCAGQQAWVRKEQFKEAAPVRPQFGLKMLQKMGWTPGEGLGKNKEGAIEPLLLDVKMDKKGFHAQEELTPKKQPIPMAKDLSARKCNKLHSGLGKHPVSALVELCSKHKWQPPEFEMVFDYGPDHKKNFLMKVKVNGQEYKPAVAGPTKKLAKANAAAACLQSLGLFPKDPENPLTEAA